MMFKNVLFLILLNCPLWAGKRIVTDGVLGETKMQTELLLDATRFRVNVDSKTSLLFRTVNGKDELLQLDVVKSQYSVIDQGMFDRIAAPLRALTVKIDDMMKDLPPELREQAKKALQPQRAAAPRILSTGTDLLDGVACTIYEVMSGEVKETETCIAQLGEFGISAEAFSILERAAIYQLEMLKGLEDTMLGPELQGFRDVLVAHPGLSGIALRSTTFSQGKVVYTQKLRSVEDAVFTDADFSLGDAVKVELPIPALP